MRNLEITWNGNASGPTGLVNRKISSCLGPSPTHFFFKKCYFPLHIRCFWVQKPSLLKHVSDSHKMPQCLQLLHPYVVFEKECYDVRGMFYDVTAPPPERATRIRHMALHKRSYGTGNFVNNYQILTGTAPLVTIMFLKDAH